tara:strand:- start:96 stop:443 length:348 start_codon:yes stop_codon:yes gene_type:complete
MNTMNESAAAFFATFDGLTAAGNPKSKPMPKRNGLSKAERTMSTLRWRAEQATTRYEAVSAFLTAFSQITENRERAQVNVNGENVKAELVALAMGVDDTPTKRDAMIACVSAFCC